MSAQEINAPDDRWFRISLAHLSWPLLKDQCVAKHAQNAPGTILGLNENFLGTEAIVKVRGAKAWKPSISAAVLQTYEPKDLSTIQALVRSTEWTGAT